MAKKSKTKDSSSTIALNKKARHDYAINETLEAGLALEGWEVKSLRDKRANITDTYVMIQKNEAWLIGAHITPRSETNLNGVFCNCSCIIVYIIDLNIPPHLCKNINSFAWSFVIVVLTAFLRVRATSFS